MVRLWLDDIRDPVKYGKFGWLWVKTADEAVAAFRKGDVVEASLDHDLTPEQMTGGIYGVIVEDGFKSGYDVITWLEQHPEFWPSEGIVSHSGNPAGRARIEQVIRKHYEKNFLTKSGSLDRILYETTRQSWRKEPVFQGRQSWIRSYSRMGSAKETEA